MGDQRADIAIPDFINPVQGEGNGWKRTRIVIIIIARPLRQIHDRRIHRRSTRFRQRHPAEVGTGDTFCCIGGNSWLVFMRHACCRQLSIAGERGESGQRACVDHSVLAQLSRIGSSALGAVLTGVSIFYSWLETLQDS